MNRMQALKLVETTTATQKKNGTSCWYDPITDMYYASYASGYVRRIPGSPKLGAMYPLNPRIPNSPGLTYKLLDCSEDREDLMLRGVSNYRKGFETETQETHPRGLSTMEHTVLNQLNMKALLVLELESLLRSKKLTVNHKHLCDLSTTQLQRAINAFNND